MRFANQVDAYIVALKQELRGTAKTTSLPAFSLAKGRPDRACGRLWARLARPRVHTLLTPLSSHYGLLR